MDLALSSHLNAYVAPMIERDPHLILKIETKQPIELGEFVSTFVGLGSAYERFLDNHHSPDDRDARFYVREVRAGSIIAELIPVVAAVGPALGIGMAAVSYANDLSDFVGNIRERLRPYFKKNGRAEDAGKGELNDFLKTVQAVAHDEDGSLSLAVFENGEQTVAFQFTTAEARRAEANILDHRAELETTTAADYQRVILRFVRPSAEAGKRGRKGGERGIIEKISPTARPIVYASDLAEQRMKHELREAHGNVFRQLFDVDVNVELNQSGRPVAYRITAVHSVFDSEDDLLL